MDIRLICIGPLQAGLLAGLLIFLAFLPLDHRLVQETLVVLGMLKEVLGHDPVPRGLGITRQRKVFFDNLLRRAAHLALWTGALEDAIDVVAIAGLAIAATPRAVRFL